MKKQRLLLLPLPLLLSTACPPEVEPPPPPPPENQCTLDLNIDTVSAGEVAADAPATGILCPAFDQDFFSFDVADDGTIVVVTLTMPEGSISAANPAYKIVKDDGTALGAPTPFFGQDPARVNNSDPTNFSKTHRLDVAGKYYVLVQDADFQEDGQDITNAYTLAIKLLPDPDVSEPNNNEDEATPIAGATITGQIATSGDEDWYAITVPAGAQIIDATITAPADSGVQHTATLLASDALTELLGVSLAEGDVAGEVTARLRSRANGGETAYLVVRDDDNTESQLDATLGTYTVALTVLANPDPNEGAAGNDSGETATVVTSGSTLDGVIATTADQDVYRITPPGGTSAANPRILVVTVEMDTAISEEEFKPQVVFFSVDPENDGDPCGDSCSAGGEELAGICDQERCKRPRLQRFINAASYRTAFPVRDTRNVLVVVNEAGDDAFQEGGEGYRISLEMIDDPDPGEAGDDFLIPNLEFAGFANGDELRRQFNESRGRARALATTFVETCDATGEPAGACVPRVAVPAPGTGFPSDRDTYRDCADPGATPISVVASGRLTYEGDRDYFAFDLPTRSYHGLTFTYSAAGAGNTPVELAIFLHATEADSDEDFGEAIANTLEAQEVAPAGIPQGPDCQATCCDSRECGGTAVCVDGRCWADGPSNPVPNNRVFPQGDDCAFNNIFEGPPYILEVVDNGLNDFDIDVTYTVTIEARCGCPAECDTLDNGFVEQCQGVAEPN